MSGFGYSLLGFLLAIAILVAVHEFGHFWVARKLGVKVLRFSIGFGRPLFRWQPKNDPTEYSIGMIPLGGYVKMLDEREGEVSADELHLAFNNKSLKVRSAVVFAGPAFNFLFAILAIWLVFQIGAPDVKPIVGEILPESIAETAGFRPGDKLLSVDGREVQTWGEHQFYMLHQAMKGNPITFEVESEQTVVRTIELDFAAIDQSQISGQPITSQIGLYPPPPRAEVSRLVPEAPAALAGLQKGDVITAINGEQIAHWFEMVEAVSSRPGEELDLTIRRGETELSQKLTTARTEVDGKEYGRIGIYMPDPQNTRLRYGPLEAVWASVDYNWRMTAITFRSLGRMLTTEMSSENLSGPITIARLAGDTVQSGLVDFLRFLAIISVSLGLLNLMPIPVLDGGHLMYYLVEAVTGKEPSETVMLRGQQIGIALLVLLMSLAFYNDIMRLFGLI